MQIFNPTKSKFLSLTFLLILTQINAQTRWEYGVGFGISYGNEARSIDSEEVGASTFNSPLILPYVHTRVGFRIDEKSKLSLNPGFCWSGNKPNPDPEVEFAGVYLDLPFIYHRKIFRKLKALGGVQYQYLVRQSIDNDGRSTNANRIVDARNFFGVNLGLSYDIGKYIELIFSGHHNLNNLTTFDITNSAGTRIGTVDSKIRYLRLGIVMRG